MRSVDDENQADAESSEPFWGTLVARLARTNCLDRHDTAKTPFRQGSFSVENVIFSRGDAVFGFYYAM